MIAAMRTWLLGLAGAALFCAVAMELTPKGAVRGIVNTLCGIVMLAALFSPALRFPFSGYAVYLERYREEAEALTARAEERANIYQRQGIQQRLEAYILEEARQMGAETGEVRVTCAWSTEDLWLPAEVSLEGPYHAALAVWIEAELGIPREKQVWGRRSDEGN